jgi:hypothetical protein
MGSGHGTVKHFLPPPGSSEDQAQAGQDNPEDYQRGGDVRQNVLQAGQADCHYHQGYQGMLGAVFHQATPSGLGSAGLAGFAKDQGRRSY